MLRTLSVVFLLSVLDLSPVQTYQPQDDGSRIHFTIRNLGIRTGGNFTGLHGSIRFNPDAVANSYFNVAVKAATIDTDNGQRDKSLRTEYFEVEKFPEIRMTSTKIERTNKTSEGYYYFSGNLTIKGVTKEIAFPFKVQRAGSDWIFTGDLEINRLDYNIGKPSSFLSSSVSVSLKVKAKAN